MAESDYNQFCIKKTAEVVSNCVTSEDEVLMDQYILMYTELTKFVELLGTVFGFVNKDIREKLAILTAHRQGKASDHYVTVRSMVEYEITQGILESKKHTDQPNGSRSLLRLHRALEFIMGFLAIIKDSESKVPLTTSVHACYKKTLAKYHGWIIQKGVHVALYTLPSKEKLIHMVGNTHTDEEGKAEFACNIATIVDKLNVIYDIVQECYADHNVLNLP